MTMCHQKDPRRLLLGMAIVMLFGAMEQPVAMVHAQGTDPKLSLAIDFAGSGTGRVTTTPGPDSPDEPSIVLTIARLSITSSNHQLLSR